MTYVVGWSPFHRDAGAVELACQLAKSAGERLHVMSVLPSGWGGLGKRDEARSEEEGERAVEEARSYLDAAGVEGDVISCTAKSVPQALLDAAEETSARMIVLGSGTEAGIGRIAVSSKANRLLHSSPVPVAVAPRGHRADDAKVSRVTCAFRNEEASHTTLEAAARYSDITNTPLRLVTFGVEPRRMYPAEVSGGDTMVLEEWRRQSCKALDDAIAALDRDDVTRELVVGRSWDDVLHEVDWDPGEILIVGSSSSIKIAQVFLGSSATKIVRCSPVPVIVMP